jgi:very-short-patch-repair endonuclease
MVRVNGKVHHTKQERKILSEKRKKYLKENPDKHPWKAKNKQRSVPCEILKKTLKENGINFIEEYQPLYPDRFFSIDIAFPDKKIGIEINGNQHYTNEGVLTSYYKERHRLIEKSGWKLYEFHYSSVYNGMIENSIEKILEKAEVVQEFDYKFWISNKEKRILEERKRKEKKEKKKQEDINRILYKLESSDINFSKLGWVEHASKIVGITPQKVGKWMERNLPEFYEKCYVRKTAPAGLN